MKSKIKKIMLDKILYIGEEIPDSLVSDKRPKFILLGTPSEFIRELAAELEKGRKG